jgi:hypothetical protein
MSAISGMKSSRGTIDILFALLAGGLAVDLQQIRAKTLAAGRRSDFIPGWADQSYTPPPQEKLAKAQDAT